MAIRIGQGIDVHEFCAHRELYLGGVKIPSDFGLKGHSDADVLLHSITDAVLGALSWKDIGCWFPNDDAKFKDIQSEKLFLEVWNKATAEGWSLINCDSTILAEKPKLSPHFEEIKKNVARLFNCNENQIGIKATTSEKLGFVGREEGIFATTVILLENNR